MKPAGYFYYVMELGDGVLRIGRKTRRLTSHGIWPIRENWLRMGVCL